MKVVECGGEQNKFDLLYKLECFVEISTTEKNRIWYT